MDNGVITTVLNLADQINQQFVMQGYEKLASLAAPIIAGSSILSLILFGYGVGVGWITTPFPEMVKRIFIIGFVVILALDWATFSEYVYHVFNDFPNEVAGKIVSTIPNSNFSDAKGINSALETVLYDGIEIANAVYEQGSMTNLMPYFYYIAIMILWCSMATIVVLELLVAKFGLAIYLILAPLMIASYIFSETRTRFFDGWLNGLIGFSLIPVFISATLTLSLMIISKGIGIQDGIKTDQLDLSSIVPYLIYILISIGLLSRVTGMAMSIAGGFSNNVASNIHQRAKQVRNSALRKLMQFRFKK